jgi:hypothetical protein
MDGAVLQPAWLPFYRTCVGLGLRAFPDLFLTPRIIAFSFGIASILAAGWLAQELFQDHKTTLLTLTLSAFFSQRIALSLAPLSDIMFIVAILAAMALFACWLLRHSRSSLFACALCGALATTIRYEGWVFAAAILLAVAVAPAPRKDLFLFGLILLSFPAAWSLHTLLVTNPVQVVMNDARQFSFRQIMRKNPLVEFTVSNIVSLNLIGGLAIWRIRNERPLGIVILTSFTPLLIAVCGAAAHR